MSKIINERQLRHVISEVVDVRFRELREEINILWDHLSEIREEINVLRVEIKRK